MKTLSASRITAVLSLVILATATATIIDLLGVWGFYLGYASGVLTIIAALTIRDWR